MLCPRFSAAGSWEPGRQAGLCFDRVHSLRMLPCAASFLQTVSPGHLARAKTHQLSTVALPS